MKYEVEFIGDDEMQWWEVRCMACGEEVAEGLGFDAAEWIEWHECAPEPYRPGYLFPDGEAVIPRVLTEERA